MCCRTPTAPPAEMPPRAIWSAGLLLSFQPSSASDFSDRETLVFVTLHPRVVEEELLRLVLLGSATPPLLNTRRA
eukprot:8654850-Pyramimonas_sp.AAC.1